MGLLTGDLATSVYKAFKGKLLTGLIRQTTVAESGGLDQYGDPIDVASTDTVCEGFVENYADYFRAKAGIPEFDIQVNIFAKSIPGITPTKDDIVQMNGRWYQLRSAKTDPATALWTCQAYPIPEQE